MFRRTFLSWAIHLGDMRTMCKTVYLVGPSGIGKSTLARMVRDSDSTWTVVDLDDLIKKYHGISASVYYGRVGDDGFLEACQKALIRYLLSEAGQNFLVIVGAGALQSKNALGWLSGETVIAIIADHKEAHKRIRDARADQRTLAQYVAVEFSVYRQKIYQTARFTIDTSRKDTDESVAKLKEKLDGLK